MANSNYDISDGRKQREKEFEFEDWLKNWGKDWTDFTTPSQKWTVDNFANLSQKVSYLKHICFKNWCIYNFLSLYVFMLLYKRTLFSTSHITFLSLLYQTELCSPLPTLSHLSPTYLTIITRNIPVALTVVYSYVADFKLPWQNQFWERTFIDGFYSFI